MYRRPGSDDWQPLGSYNILTREGPNPYAVDPARSTSLTASKRQMAASPCTAWRSTAPAGASWSRRTIRVDMAGLVRIGAQPARGRGELTRPSARGDLFRSGDSALARAPVAGVAGAAAGPVRRCSLRREQAAAAGWKRHRSGPLLHLREGDRRLNEIMLSRPQLEGVQMAEVRAVSYQAADGTMVPGYLTLPPGSNGRGLPAIVMPHGGPGARDEWGFDWLAQYYAQSRLCGAAAQFPRFGRLWRRMVRQNGFQSWRIAIGDVNDAGRWLVQPGDRRSAQAGDRRLVLWRLCGAAVERSSIRICSRRWWRSRR